MGIYTLATYLSDLQWLSLLQYCFNIHLEVFWTWATSFLPMQSTDCSLES